MKKIFFLLLIVVFLCTGCSNFPEQGTTSQGDGDSNGNAAKSVDVSVGDDVGMSSDIDSDITIRQKDSSSGGVASDIQVKQKGRGNAEQITYSSVVIIQVNEDSMIVANMEDPNILYSIDLFQTKLKGEQGTEISSVDIPLGQVAQLIYSGELETGNPMSVKGNTELQLLGKNDKEILERGTASLEAIEK